MVGIGGGIGSVLRFWVSSYLGERISTRFPFGTFAVNITGSFLIGFIVTLLASKANWDPNWRYLIPIGFIGGYTTFSAFEYETLRSMQDGKILVASDRFHWGIHDFFRIRVRNSAQHAGRENTGCVA